MSPSTTHRYVKTLKAVGLLEQNPTTREYRPVSLDE
jgi:DNA-binding IclR family transcriptional regulator